MHIHPKREISMNQQSTVKKGLTVKDLVTVGIFSALFLVFALVGGIFFAPNPVLTFYMPVGSALLCGPVYLLIENEARPPKELSARVAQTAKELHIQKLLRRNIFDLSGGEKQKIAFASVYAMDPEVYLLDEPSSNLDMTAIGVLREHLKRIKAQGKTVIVAEHRLYYLMDVVDRVVYLENGHIAGNYTPEQFCLLPAQTRQEMGLRSMDLHEEKPKYFSPPKAVPVLELQNVTLSYQKQPILKNISLQAAPGEVIAVAGHNGAGKTTFSRAL